MSGTKVAIIGASGYSGIELTRLCAQHPHVELRLLASDRWAGDTLRHRLGMLGASADLAYTAQEQALESALKCDVAFLATPIEASLTLAPRLVEGGVRVIDLSGAFRLRDAADYPRWYGLSHPRPALLADAVYGLPELGAAGLAGARLVANPGCYATAAALALAPLFSEGVLADAPVIVDAASGATGAGRKATEDMSFSEVDADFRAYRVLRHQHTPEIAASLARAAGRPVGLTFTAHLLPVKRGILATAYGRLAAGRGVGDPLRALMHVYASSRFVSVVPTPDEVRLRDVVRTNRCVVSAAAGEPGGVVVAIAAIDNLLKGAAGQAIQNLNIMMGWDESAGLAGLAFHGGHP